MTANETYQHALQQYETLNRDYLQSSGPDRRHLQVKTEEAFRRVNEATAAQILESATSIRQRRLLEGRLF